MELRQNQLYLNGKIVKEAIPIKTGIKMFHDWLDSFLEPYEINYSMAPDIIMVRKNFEIPNFSFIMFICLLVPWGCQSQRNYIKTVLRGLTKDFYHN